MDSRDAYRVIGRLEAVAALQQNRMTAVSTRGITAEGAPKKRNYYVTVEPLKTSESWDSNTIRLALDLAAELHVKFWVHKNNLHFQ